VLYLLMASLLIGQPADSTESPVLVRLEGFSSRDGYVRLAIFDSRDFWPEDIDNAVLRLTSIIEGDTVTMDISELPPGSYAMAAFHDEDGDAVFDRGLFGVPTEDYGFSNNVRSSTGPPDFQDALVSIEGDSLVLHITLE